MENENTRVKVSLGYTLNLGNFQSLRIDLGIDEDRKENETVSEAFDRVYSFVEQRLVEKINEAKTEMGE